MDETMDAAWARCEAAASVATGSLTLSRQSNADPSIRYVAAFTDFVGSGGDLTGTASTPQAALSALADALESRDPSAE